MEETETVITENNEQTAVEETAQKTYSFEEVEALIEKGKKQALAKQKKQYEKQISLSKLDGDEREKAEKDNRIAELEEKLAQYEIEKNKSELKSV